MSIIPPLSGVSEGTLRPKYPVPELEVSERKQLKNPKGELKKIDKQVDNAIKLCIAAQERLNDDYESLLQGKEGMSASELTKIAKELRQKEEELRSCEMQLALFSKHKKSSEIGLKILQARQQIKTVAAKHGLLSNLKDTESPIPQAFSLRKEILDHLEKIAKQKSGASVPGEFCKALEKYMEIVHMAQKPTIAPEHKKILDEELKVLRLKMRALAPNALAVSRKELQLLDSFRGDKKLSQKEVIRGREALMKLAMAEIFFPSLPTEEFSRQDNRKLIVNRFMIGFSTAMASSARDLLDQDMEFLKSIFELVTPLGGKKEHYSLEVDQAPSEIATKAVAVPYDKEVPSKERTWTKISTGFLFSRSRHSKVKEVAGRVEALGKKCIQAMKFVDGEAIKLSVGEVKDAQDLGKGLGELGIAISEIEEELTSLRSLVATFGYDKVGTDIEKVIARQTNLLNGIRAKESELRQALRPDYVDAANQYKEGMASVQAALKLKSDSGVRLFEAQLIAEKLRANPGLSDPSAPPSVKEDLKLFIKKIETAISAARVEGAVSLTKDEKKLRDHLAKAYLSKDVSKLKLQNHETTLKSLLAKEMTQALFYTSPEKREIKVVQILSIMDLMKAEDHGREVLKSILDSKEMAPLFSRFENDMTYPELKEAIASRNQIRKILISLSYAVELGSKDKDAVGKEMYRAMEHLATIERALGECHDVHQKALLGKMHENAARLLAEQGKPILQLTHDKEKMFAKMLKGEFTSRHNLRRVDAMLSKSITRFLHFSDQAEKIELGNHISIVLANIQALKPELYQELVQDASLKQLIDLFLVQMKPGRIEFESFAKETDYHLSLAKKDRKNAVYHIYNAIESQRKAAHAAAQMEDPFLEARSRALTKAIEEKGKKYLAPSKSDEAFVNKLADPENMGKSNLQNVRRALAKTAVFAMLDTQARRTESFQQTIDTILKNLKQHQPEQYKALTEDQELQRILVTRSEEQILVSASSSSFAALEDFIRFSKQIAGATEKTSPQQIAEWKRKLSEAEAELPKQIQKLGPLAGLRPGSEAQRSVDANLAAIKLVVATGNQKDKVEIANQWYELNKPIQFIQQGVISTYTDLFAGDPIYLEPINPERLVIGHHIMAQRDPENAVKIEALVDIVKRFSLAISKVAPILGKPGCYEGSRGRDTLKLKDNLSMTPERERALRELRAEVAAIKTEAAKIGFEETEIGKIAEISRQSLFDNLEKTERQLDSLEKAIRGK